MGGAGIVEPRRSWPWLAAVAVAIGLFGCAPALRGQPATSMLLDAPNASVEAPAAVTRVAQANMAVAVVAPVPPFAERAQLTPRNGEEEVEEAIVEYDPWVRFNEKTFWFNRQVDRFLLKPVATVWDRIVPDLMQQSLANFFDHLGMPRRLVNNLLQGKMEGAGRELARFFINTSMGVLGFFDAAADLGLDKSDEDTGQTLGVDGVGPGPYLVLPFLPPLTVRDGIGFAIDGALDPLPYLVALAATAGRTGGRIVNDRALNLERFEGVEEAALDLYSAVRNAYLQRRQQAIRE
jgi:phospholipid-binding lipoprotein MlaA